MSKSPNIFTQNQGASKRQLAIAQTNILSASLDNANNRAITESGVCELDGFHSRLTKNLNEQSGVDVIAGAESLQKLTGKGKKFNSMKAEKKLDKYVRDLETLNVTNLSQLMSNKKYFHKFYQLQDLNRISLLTQDGKLNDKAFELINDNSQFQKAVNDTLRIAPSYQAAQNEADRDPARKYDNKVLQESQKRYQSIWKNRAERRKQFSVDLTKEQQQYGRTGPFLPRNYMMNINSERSLYDGPEAV